MKLKFDVEGKNQPDPFIFEDEGKLYLYVTARQGVELYTTEDLFGVWRFQGICTDMKEAHSFWAPSVIRYGDRYYMYVSCVKKDCSQFMHVLSSDSPAGPFTDPRMLYHQFSIDSHMVETEAGLFLWFCLDRTEGQERIGTRIFVQKYSDPYTPVGSPREMIVPTFDQERFTPQYSKEHPWHTIEGAFWLREGEWQYVMYSGGCYQDDTYHIGYAAAHSTNPNLCRVDFIKHTEDGKFAPVIIKNDFEEGTGHHSVIKYKGEYLAIYHGRDYKKENGKEYKEARTARVCRLHIKDGIITAERHSNSL